MSKFFYFICFILFFSLGLEARNIETIFGSFEEDDPLVLEIIDSPVMQRLKNIQQHGVIYYIGGVPSFTRYDHSLGVYYLLKKFEAPYKERIAGLLHDTSHTVFSHLGDFIYPQQKIEQAYQDEIIYWWLTEQKIEEILNKHQLTLDDVSPKSEVFKRLEQPIPELCADRIEYLCHTGLVFDFLDKEDVKRILSDIRYDSENKKWYFVNVVSAKKIAALSLYFTQHFWGTTWNYVVNHYFSCAIKQAMDLGLVSFEEVHFSTDKEILEKIAKSDIAQVKKNYEYALHAKTLFREESVTRKKGHQLAVKTKFRGVDPLIFKDGNFQKLSEMDEDFKEYFEYIKKWTQRRVKVSMQPLHIRGQGGSSV